MEAASALYVGIDLGTSGARSIVMGATRAVLVTAKAAFDRIAHLVPDWSPARGSTGGLAYAILLQAQDPARICHKTDRMHHHLTWGWVGDYSLALKTGYDPLAGRWPDWLEDAGLDRARLHHVVPAVSVVGILADLSVARLEDLCSTAGTLPDFILPAFATGI